MMPISFVCAGSSHGPGKPLKGPTLLDVGPVWVFESLQDVCCSIVSWCHPSIHQLRSKHGFGKKEDTNHNSLLEVAAREWVC